MLRAMASTTVVVETDLGTFEIALDAERAPKSVENFLKYVDAKHYDGTIFHRVIPGFMAQGGGYDASYEKKPVQAAVENEADKTRKNTRGTVAMARAQSEDSANSQFFIVFYPRFSLDRNYTNFGRVIGGMDAVDAIQRGEPPQDPTYIVQASIAADNKPPKLPPATPAAAATLSADELSNSTSN